MTFQSLQNLDTVAILLILNMAILCVIVVMLFSIQHRQRNFLKRYSKSKQDNVLKKKDEARPSIFDANAMTQPQAFLDMVKSEEEMSKAWKTKDKS